MTKKYTEVYMQRTNTICVLVESDVTASEQDIIDLAETHAEENDMHSCASSSWKADKEFGTQTETDNPQTDIVDWKGWQNVFVKDTKSE